MKLSRSRLRKIILEEAKVVSEGLGFGKLSPWGSKSTISKRAQLNKHGKEDEYERRYYIVITSPDGDRDRHAYSGYTDDQAWDEAARIKRDGDYAAGAEFDIYEDTIEGDRYIGAIAGFGMDDDELFSETLKIKKSDVARIISEEINEHFEGSARHRHPHAEDEDMDEEAVEQAEAEGYIEDPEDPQEAYDGDDPIDLWHELGDLITSQDLSLYEKLGPEKYESIVPIAREYSMMKLREAYGRFFRLVARPSQNGVETDPETGKMKIKYEWKNEYNLFPAQARALFDGKTGNLTIDQAKRCLQERKSFNLYSPRLIQQTRQIRCTEGGVTQ